MQEKTKRPFILLVNDDGVSAPGIRVLARELENIADVMTIAPHMEKSASSQAITITAPLRLHEVADNVYSVEGTPADCVMLALQHLVPKKPDWVISGINRGGNMGTDILYSGTVGAALEGCITGCKAIAVSLEGLGREPLRYEVAARVVRMLLENEDVIHLGEYEMLNINVPNIAFNEIRGIRATNVGKRIYEGKMWERHDPRGQRYFWIGGSGFGHENIEGSDCVVLNEGYVTLSVLKPNLYHEEATNRLADKVKNKFDSFFR